jgi:hypothetical protein
MSGSGFLNDPLCPTRRGRRSIERRSPLAILLVATIVALPIGACSAHSISAPVASEAPSPEACTVEPRDISSISTLASSPPAQTTPAAGSGGRSADEATVGAVTATVREAIACANANDPLRLFAFFTDRYVAERFGPAHPDDLGSLAAALSRPPSPADEADRLALDEIRNVDLLSDGRAQAIVVTENAAGRYVDRLVFARVDDRWLIDDWEPVETDAATPTSGA